MKIEDKVHFKNEFISNEQVEPYFKAADFICLPYNSASQSGIIMIAYGFGKPVVVTDVGGLPELVVEGKTGFIANNNKQFSEYTLELFKNNELWTNIKNNLKEIRGSKSWLKCTKSFLTAVNESI